MGCDIEIKIDDANDNLISSGRLDMGENRPISFLGPKVKEAKIRLKVNGKRNVLFFFFNQSLFSDEDGWSESFTIDTGLLGRISVFNKVKKVAIKLQGRDTHISIGYT